MESRSSKLRGCTRNAGGNIKIIGQQLELGCCYAKNNFYAGIKMFQGAVSYKNVHLVHVILVTFKKFLSPVRKNVLVENVH